MTKTKTFTVILALCGLISACFYYLEYAETKAFQLKEAISLIHDTQSRFLMMHRSRNDYFDSFDQTHVAAYQRYGQMITQNIQKIRRFELTEGIQQATVSIDRGVQRNIQIFLALVELQNGIGINPNRGAYGALRNAAHKIEHIFSENQHAELLNQLLNLRRIEKDFMLEPSEQQYQRFIRQYPLFEALTKQQTYTVQDQRILEQAMGAYFHYFEDYAKKTMKMGIQVTDGLFGQLSMQEQQLENHIQYMMQSIIQLSNQTESSIHAQSKALAYFFPVLIIVLSLFIFTRLYSKRAYA